MKNILKRCDNFSQGFHLTYKGNKTLKTELGGCLTIIAIIIILTNGFLIGKDIFYKQNPTVLTIEKNLDFAPVTRINYKNIFFGYAITNGTEFYEDDSVFNVIPYFSMIYYNKNYTLKHKKIILEITDCTREFKKLNRTAPFIASYFKNIKCIKDLDLILSGSWKENPLQYFNFEVQSCKNHSTLSNEDSFNDEEKAEFIQLLTNFTFSNQLGLNYFSLKTEEEKKNIIKSTIYYNKNYSNPNIQCKSQDEIRLIIPDLYFNFFYNKISLNSKNYSNPINSQGATDWVKLGNSIYKEATFQFNHYILSTDNGLIFTETSKEEVSIGYKQHSLDYSNKTEHDETLINTYIYISNNVQYLSREYIKIQTIFANLGGIIKMIFFIFRILYDPFLNKKLNLKIANKIFEFDDDNIEKVYNIDDLNILHLKDMNINKNINNRSIYRKNQEKSNLYKNNFSDSRRQFNLNHIDSSFSKKKDEIIKIDNFYLNEKLPKITKNIEMTRNSNKINIPTNKNIKIFSSNFEINKNFFIEKQQKENKLKVHNKEIIKYLYCRCLFKNHLLEKKNELLCWASENLFEYTDFLSSIKLHSDILKLKYFIFNNHQLKSLEFINNPKKYRDGLVCHHNNEFALVYKKLTKKTDSIPEIIEYFKNRLKLKNLDEIDVKLLDSIDPELKILINSDEDNL